MGIETMRGPGLLGSLALILAAPGGSGMAQAIVATGVGTPFELAFWQSIDSSSDAALYEAYLTRYPGGTFSEIARARIVALRGRAAPPPAPAVAFAPTVPVENVTPVAATVPLPPPAPPATTVQPAVAAPTSTMGQLLAALANSQATTAPANPAPAHSPAFYQPPLHAFAVPAQPVLAPVPAVSLPPSFCSAEARNAFHDAVYAPSVNLARQNNEAAVGYMRQLQALYDQYQLSHDPDMMNAIVVAARRYQLVTQTTFSIQGALVRQFGALMTVPVVACTQPMQPPAQTLAK